MGAMAVALTRREILRLVAGYITKILSSVIVMGFLTAAQQYLGSQAKAIGQSVMGMISIMYRSFRNRNK